LVSPPAV